MKPKFAALNLALLAGITAVGWQAKIRWDEAQARQNAVVQVKVKPVNLPQPAPAAPPEAAPAVKYADVAKKNLFSKDRDPNVVIEAPKEVEKPKPMPKLPVVYGVMGLPSGVKAVMAERQGEASSVVKTGDMIGEFKIVALNQKNVTFNWNGTEVNRTIDSLLDRGSESAGASTGGAVQRQGAVVADNNRQSIAASTQKPNTVTGVEIGSAGGPTVRACSPGDNSPAGTVVDGYTKVVQVTPFGNACRWVANAK